jgi:RpiB/LacA/LacB family sugar-phosphate isomerase
MRVAIASDHAGFELKQKLLKFLSTLGFRVKDLGTHSRRPVDYPDYAEAMGLAILKREADRGILICGSGVGASIAANKMPGIRAGLCHDHYSAHQGVEHDDMNVLVLGAWVVTEQQSKELVDVFLHARFSGELRHVRRVKKTMALSEKYREELLPQRSKKAA